MKSHQEFRQIIEQTRVLRFPRYRLATFGASEISYSIVSAVSQEPARSTLRTGRVTAERPRILSAEALSRQFEGFGEQSDTFERWLKDTFRDAFRGLEYTFRNQLTDTTPHQADARELAERVQKDLEARDVSRAAVIFGPEKGWQFALMKFILEETSQSFPTNVRELEERGLFNPMQAVLNRQRREVETLFQRAAADPAALAALGGKLKEYNLFDEYQDRFFQLVTPRRPTA
jgi:hypothetical protein